MHLNVYTLFVLELVVLAFLAMLMFFAWLGGRRDLTLGYLAATMLSAVFGTLMGSLRGLHMDIVPILFGNMMLLLAYGLQWTAMRVFTGRPPHWQGVLAGPIVWLLLCLCPLFMQTLTLRIMVSGLLTMIYTLLAAREVWRGRRALLVTYWPALLLMLLHSAVYFIRLLFDRGQPFAELTTVPGASFFALLIFETILYATGMAFTTLAMVNERAQLMYKHASLSDPLTGIANRRALIERGEQLLARCEREQAPVTLILFDLDNFKGINDSHGHHGGDRALVAFCDIATRCLQPHHIFARIGGEEFGCLLPLPTQDAQSLAERIRCQVAAQQRLAHPLTVSGGIASSTQSGFNISSLLVDADHALYRAKAGGKNRIEVN